MKWFSWNGKLHVLVEEDPPKGHCGVRPVIAEMPTPMQMDTLDVMRDRPCRTCLLMAATADDMIEGEPLREAIGRGVLPITEVDLKDRNVL